MNIIGNILIHLMCLSTLYMGDILLITYGDILLNPTFKWGNFL